MTDERNERIALTIDSLIRSAEPPVAFLERDSLREMARELLQEQRTEFLDPTIKSQSKYFNTLVSISTIEAEIIELVEKSQQYINEKVLWIRSTQPLYTNPLPTQDEWWFTLPAAWNHVENKLIEDLVRRMGSWLAAAIALGALVCSRFRLRQEISELGKNASQSSFTHFLPTMKAFLWTVAIAAPIPLAFWFLASRFSSISGSDRMLAAFAMSFKNLAFTYFPLEFTRQVCRTDGLAEAHFDWPPSALQKLRRQLRSLLWFAVPLSAFAAFLSGGSVGYGNDVLQRYASLGAITVLGIFLYLVLHPRHGAPARYLASHPAGWLRRMSYLWFPIMLAIPIALGVLTIFGYHFTSQQIGWRFFESVMLMFGISVAISLVMRWSLIHRRRLRIEQLQAQRALLQQKASEQDEESSRESSVVDETESPEELQEQMQQSRSLFRTAMIAAAFVGLWLVWSDIVPALEIFEKWPLWITTDAITEMVANEAGDLIPQTREIPDPVTIADVGLGVLILLITFAAGRNLPGLLEFAVLRQLPLDRSVRYAITTLVSYAIVLLGVIIAGGTAGLHWNQVQWMATALTFGLAFGLQEMFANFIAGIIILFEQPVRVGDVVEIDGVTGIVSRIRIRATTITDWDRKDFIVPNKEFITGKLLNWTRSDEIYRLKVPVGVAYGSDTSLARKLLLEAAAEHPDVLEDPPVLAIFESFGASSLDFTLQAFINTYEKRLHICNDLHMAVDQKFREANIEISFPQSDLHLRTFPADMQRFFRESQKAQQETPVQTQVSSNLP